MGWWRWSHYIRLLKWVTEHMKWPNITINIDHINWDRSHQTASRIFKWFGIIDQKQNTNEIQFALRGFCLRLEKFLTRFHTNWNRKELRWLQCINQNSPVTSTRCFPHSPSLSMRVSVCFVLYQFDSFYVPVLVLSSGSFSILLYENRIDSCSHSRTNTHKGDTAFAEPIKHHENTFLHGEKSSSENETRAKKYI